jgi:hypothetical protein
MGGCRVGKRQIRKPRDLDTVLVSGTPAGQSSYLLAMFHLYRKVSGEHSNGLTN